MSRKLTAGEIEIAGEIYGESIRYDAVKIHDGKLFFGQPDNSGMTPLGEIHAHGNVYHADYTNEHPEMQSFFIHEMGHVWQHQNGILNVIWSALLAQITHGFNYGRAYPYLLETDKTLTDYNLEQQASMLEDYFRVARHGLEFRPNRILNGGSREENLQLLESVLAEFIADPSLPNR